MKARESGEFMGISGSEDCLGKFLSLAVKLEKEGFDKMDIACSVTRMSFLFAASCSILYYRDFSRDIRKLSYDFMLDMEEIGRNFLFIRSISDFMKERGSEICDAQFYALAKELENAGGCYINISLSMHTTAQELLSPCGDDTYDRDFFYSWEWHLSVVKLADWHLEKMGHISEDILWQAEMAQWIDQLESAAVSQ